MVRYRVQRYLAVFAIVMGLLWAGIPAAAIAADEGVGEFDMRKSIDEINKRLDEVETKALMDKINLGAEIRSRFDWYAYKKKADEVAGTPDIDEHVNGLASTQVRLNLRADVSDSLRFTGRLAMYKLWGDKTFHTEFDDLSLGREPSNATFFVERAYVDCFFNVWKMPVAFTFGRLPLDDGLPTDLREDSPRKSTYPSLAWDAQADAIALTVGLENVINLPGSNIRLLYTDWITDNEDAPYRELSQYGYDYPTSTPIYAAQFETGLPGFLDGTLFMVDFLYAPSVQLRDDAVEKIRTGIAKSTQAGLKDTFGVAYPVDVTITNVTAPNSLGSLSKAVAFIESKNFLGSWVDWFAGFCWEKNKSNGQVVVSYVYQTLSPADPTVPVINRPAPYAAAFMSSAGGETLGARAYHAGFRLNLPVKALNYPKFGVEYNHASEHWYGLTYASEDPLHKLEERGSVWDFYYIQPISRYFKSRVGYTLVKRDYDHNAYGDPIENDVTISNMYILLDVRF